MIFGSIGKSLRRDEPEMNPSNLACLCWLKAASVFSSIYIDRCPFAVSEDYSVH